MDNMKRLRFVCLLACCIVFAAAALADDVKPLNGDTLYNAKPIRQDVSSVTFSHSKGVTRLLFADMSEADKIKYGYDAAKEADYRKAVEIRQMGNAAYEKLLYALTVDGQPYDFSSVFRTKVIDRAVDGKAVDARAKPYILVGTVAQVLSDGILVDSTLDDRDRFEDMVLLKDYREESTVTDGEKIFIIGLVKGRFRYVSVSKVVKTIPVFYSARKDKGEITAENILPLP